MWDLAPDHDFVRHNVWEPLWLLQTVLPLNRKSISQDFLIFRQKFPKISQGKYRNFPSFSQVFGLRNREFSLRNREFSLSAESADLFFSFFFLLVFSTSFEPFSMKFHSILGNFFPKRLNFPRFCSFFDFLPKIPSCKPISLDLGKFPKLWHHWKYANIKCQPQNYRCQQWECKQKDAFELPPIFSM